MWGEDRAGQTLRTTPDRTQSELAGVSRNKLVMGTPHTVQHLCCSLGMGFWRDHSGQDVKIGIDHHLELRFWRKWGTDPS